MLGALRFFPSLLVASETVASDELVKEETSDQLYFQKGASCCSLGIGGVYVLKIKLGALHMIGECFPTGQQPLLYFSVCGLLKLIFAKTLYCL